MYLKEQVRNKYELIVETNEEMVSTRKTISDID